MRTIFIAMVFALSALPAWAQSKGDFEAKCLGPDAEAAIAGCTALIQGNLESGLNLSVTYYDRGSAYLRKGFLDEAIADFSKAVAVKPIPQAYNSRGLAYHRKGLYDKAVADFSQAIALKSDYEMAF